ncbi:unnamed protein product [Callosobruchus maculatus]|uniref:Uncharacterized protein n=1 Tax=Callosobruchus maculatus TaxID=64391 RepID=A0A653C8M1_CALMS|nr:unnamed protein product [Callosobruchus maculatus]
MSKTTKTQKTRQLRTRPTLQQPCRISDKPNLCCRTVRRVSYRTCGDAAHLIGRILVILYTRFIVFHQLHPAE